MIILHVLVIATATLLLFGFKNCLNGLGIKHKHHKISDDVSSSEDDECSDCNNDPISFHPNDKPSIFSQEEFDALLEKADNATSFKEVVEIFQKEFEEKIRKELNNKNVHQITDLLQSKFNISVIPDDDSISSSDDDSSSSDDQDLRNALEFCKNKSVEEVNKILKKFDVQISNAPSHGISMTIKDGIVCDIFMSNEYH